VRGLLWQMEKIMSKTNDTSNLGRAAQDRELRDDELNPVSGGIIAVLIGLILPDSQKPAPPTPKPGPGPV
jgi:hypothetical protein